MEGRVGGGGLDGEILLWLGLLLLLLLSALLELLALRLRLRLRSLLLLCKGGLVITWVVVRVSVRLGRIRQIIRRRGLGVQVRQTGLIGVP